MATTGTMSKKPDNPDHKTICRNRKAFHNFEVLEQVEAGLVLVGTEVKSLREASVTLDEAWAKTKNGEAFLMDVHIPPYKHGTWTNHKPDRPRKLLLHKREIRKLDAKANVEHLHLVPIELYFKKGIAKVAIGVCKNRKAHDKRDAIRARDEKRSIARETGRRDRDD